MTFKLKATGFGQLDRNMRAIAKEFSPQAGIADNLEDGAWMIALAARDNAVQQGLFLSGELIDSIKPRKINQFRVDVEVGVPYGAAHEFGVTVTITEKQRGFFWYMFSQTGNEMWRALALSTTYTIPARPYLRPAIDEKSKIAIGVVGQSITKKAERVIK